MKLKLYLYGQYISCFWEVIVNKPSLMTIYNWYRLNKVDVVLLNYLIGITLDSKYIIVKHLYYNCFDGATAVVRNI